jgi:hypothetical protein
MCHALLHFKRKSSLMSFRQTTQKIIKSVENTSGYRVHIYKDTSLQLPAVVKIARGSTPYHVVIYNPTSATNPDYLICVECGFILRLFSLPKESRKWFTAVDKAKADLEITIADELDLPKSIIKDLAARFFAGVLTQLRSMPINFRVDKWIRANYPDLIELQDKFVREQLLIHAKGLSPEVKKLAPSHVYDCNVAMNAVYAAVWSDTLSDPKLAIPYEHIRQKELADNLLSILKQIPDSPEKDTLLVDQWAHALDLSGWYKWETFLIN